MNSHSAVIFLITGILIAAAAGGIFLLMGTGIGPQAADEEQANVRLVAVTGSEENESINEVRIQVTSDEPIKVEDALITLRTERSEQSMTYGS